MVAKKTTKKKTTKKPAITMNNLIDLADDINELGEMDTDIDLDDCETVEEAIEAIKGVITDEDGNVVVYEEDKLNNSTFKTLELIGLPAVEESYEDDDDEHEEEEEEEEEVKDEHPREKKTTPKKKPATKKKASSLPCASIGPA